LSPLSQIITALILEEERAEDQGHKSDASSSGSPRSLRSSTSAEMSRTEPEAGMTTVHAGTPIESEPVGFYTSPSRFPSSSGEGPTGFGSSTGSPPLLEVRLSDGISAQSSHKRGSRGQSLLSSSCSPSARGEHLAESQLPPQGQHEASGSHHHSPQWPIADTELMPLDSQLLKRQRHRLSSSSEGEEEGADVSPWPGSALERVDGLADSHEDNEGL
jgi:hypothetical protein